MAAKQTIRQADQILSWHLDLDNDNHLLLFFVALEEPYWNTTDVNEIFVIVYGDASIKDQY